MSNILVQMAVPAAKRALAAQMAGLSGNVTEHSVELTTIDGGPAATWSASWGRAGEKWYGAEQAFAPQIASEMLTSGYILGTEGYFVAYVKDTGQRLDHNLPAPPADSTFEAFTVAMGAGRTVPNV